MNHEHHSDPDGVDPLRAAFEQHQRPPADIVPRRPAPTDGGLDDIADTDQVLTHYEITTDGITKHTERLQITAPILPTDERN